MRVGSRDWASGLPGLDAGLVKQLLDGKGDVNLGIMQSHKTPLAIAVQKQSVDVARWFPLYL